MCFSYFTVSGYFLSLPYRTGVDGTCIMTQLAFPLFAVQHYCCCDIPIAFAYAFVVGCMVCHSGKIIGMLASSDLDLDMTWKSVKFEPVPAFLCFPGEQLSKTRRIWDYASIPCLVVRMRKHEHGNYQYYHHVSLKRFDVIAIAMIFL